MEKFKYTPFYSFIKYIQIKTSNRLKFENQNIGDEVEVIESKKYTIFREIYLLTQSGSRKEGDAVFQVIFHAPSEKVNTVIRKTNYTIPFFIGLPGFCNKQFMVNKDKNTFAGKYEWETVDMAKKYANSFALVFMSRRSKPFQLYYRIIDKITGKVIEESEI